MYVGDDCLTIVSCVFASGRSFTARFEVRGGVDDLEECPLLNVLPQCPPMSAAWPGASLVRVCLRSRQVGVGAAVRSSPLPLPQVDCHLSEIMHVHW